MIVLLEPQYSRDTLWASPTQGIFMNIKSFLLIVSMLWSSGCITLGSVQRADTLGEGNWQVGIEPGVWGAALESDGAAVLGAFTVSGRFGVTDRFDIGGRFGTNVYEITTKYQFTDPESTGPVLSLAPSFSVFARGGAGAGFAFGHINVPLLIGLPVGKHQFIIGPRIIDVFMGAGGGGTGGFGNILMVGSSFGFHAAIGKQFGLLPEFSAVYPITLSGTSGDTSQSISALDSGLLLFQFQLGFVLGKQ